MINPSNFSQELTLIRNLFENNTIGIMIGDRSNMDTVAAGLALYLALKKTGKDVQIISKKDPAVEISNLVGIDKLKKSFSGESKRVVVSLPYNRGEIGKVSYKEEQDRINFYLTAVEGKSITPYDTQDINLNWEGAMPNVIVTFGTSNISQIRDIVDGTPNQVKIVNIDNVGEQFGDIVIVDQSFSSTSEIVAKMIRELRLPTDIDIAQNLLDGVMYGTRNFTKPNTSAYAFEAAGNLLQMGAKRADSRNTGRGNFPVQGQNPRKSRVQQFNPRQESQKMRMDDNSSRKMNYNTEPNMNIAQQSPDQDMNIRDEDSSVPNDWLMPKVFKGSQDINDLK